MKSSRKLHNKFRQNPSQKPLVKTFPSRTPGNNMKINYFALFSVTNLKSQSTLCCHSNGFRNNGYVCEGK